MSGRTRNGARLFVIAMLAPLAAACTTTTQNATVPGKSEAPVAASSVSFPRFVPTYSVDSSLAQPCITAAANKYFLPERAITAVNSRPGAGGGTDVDLKVDLRTAVCQLSAGGSVRSVIDTSPKSADQVAAEAAAAQTASAAPAPKKAKKK
ncbi:hypothetical protein [Brucella pseudogrignonensis]|uniref:Lipoprotein n=1 Tax=Brucella pseudogrignonensis TaxID=419475 RepID=A0ABU1M4F3_9HYPH|nr:hypothetical protein [Brucella pseudogrignonensis]MCL7997003.1 hypothetical protein [Brucella sp. 21LCYQ03]MDR6430692.1 hypothetical protein [Brucella pseudogrignonensis]